MLPATWKSPPESVSSRLTGHRFVRSPSRNMWTPRRDVVETWGLDQRSPTSTRSSYFNHLHNDHDDYKYNYIVYFEYFCQMSSKSILVISSYTISKLTRFLRHCVLQQHCVSIKFTVFLFTITRNDYKHVRCKYQLIVKCKLDKFQLQCYSKSSKWHPLVCMQQWNVCAIDRQRWRSLSLKPVKASSATKQRALGAHRLK